MGDLEKCRDRARAAPDRESLAAVPALQAEAILACDVFTAGLPGGSQAHVLAVIEHGSRRIRILGVTQHAAGGRTAQQARNLLMNLGEHAH